MLSHTIVVKPNTRVTAIRILAFLLTILIVIIYLVVLVRTAWLCDDAYITLRTIDNFIHGYGLTWNVSERVQAYTHPLWMLLISVVYTFTREEYFTTLYLAIGISLLAVTLFGFIIPKDRMMGLLGLSILLFSKAYIDYSTSGLENPLTHLLVGLFFLAFLRLKSGLRQVFVLCFLAACGLITRLDLALIFIPGLIYALAMAWNRKVLLVALTGLTPFWLWELFSLFYYGVAVPNPAYAKLAHGINTIDLSIQGWMYLFDTLKYDPITLVSIIGSIIFVFRIKDRKLTQIMFGMLLYLVYIIRVGGDFMSGRLLTPVLLCAVILLSQIPASIFPRWGEVLAFIGIILLGMVAPNPTVLSDIDYRANVALEDFIDETGIADERGFYYRSTGLLKSLDSPPNSNNEWAEAGRALKHSGQKVVVEDMIGFRGYFAGAGVHIVDPIGLGDPLLSRLPARPQIRWRIGHFERLIPCGYLETLRSGENRIRDANLAEYYDHLAFIIRGPLWNIHRIVEILRLNTGQYNNLLDGYQIDEAEWNCQGEYE